MALITADRDLVSATYQRDRRCPGNILKADLVAAIAAADDWVDANTASYNTALPLAFRTAATTPQKIELLMYILEKRMGKY